MRPNIVWFPIPNRAVPYDACMRSLVLCKFEGVNQREPVEMKKGVPRLIWFKLVLNNVTKGGGTCSHNSGL